MSKKRNKKKMQKSVQSPMLPQAQKPVGEPVKVVVSQPQVKPIQKIIPQSKKPCNLKTMALSAVMVMSIGVGAWFALSPTLGKQQMLEHQNKLLESIANGDGQIILTETFTVEDVDFYDDGGDMTDFIMPLSDVENAAQPISQEVVVETQTPTTTPQNSSITGIGILSIDKINLKLPVTDGVTTAQLKVAVGHVPQTAAIGEIGNTVIAGHRSYTYGDFFNRLGEMVVGDTIQYQSKDGQTLVYEVFEVLEVIPGDQTAFYQPENESILTLYTCTPIRTATHRLLVRARLVD